VRLFVALAPPAAALDELSAVLTPIRATTSPGLRWTPREQWHLTLAFLGEVDAERLPAVRRACAVAVPARCAAPLQLSGAGRFGDRVLWAGLDGDRAALVDLAARLVAALRAAGVDTDERPYRPHLTIARTVRGVSVDLRPAVDAQTVILSLQNGVENEARLEETLGSANVLGGMVYIGAELTSPGVVEHSFSGALVFGEQDGQRTPRAERLEWVFLDAGIQAQLSSSITLMLWDKLVWNAAFNAIAVLTRSTVGELLASPLTRAFQKPALLRRCSPSRVFR